MPLRTSRLIALASTSLCTATVFAAPPALRAGRATEPDFGPNVMVIDSNTPDLQQKVDAIFATQEKAQFGSERHALLFKPGNYTADVQVGFYTHVAGLGESPDDVHITGAVRSKAKWMRNNNATCNFWRAAENLSVTPTQDSNVNIWAVSQGVALRRVHIKGDLNLWDGGWSSGGFLADSKIDGKVTSGSQQQWLSRNAEWGEWNGGNWNMVFVGTTNPPKGNWPERPYTIVEKTPLIREKPFLFVNDAGEYFVQVPALSPTDTQGTTWAKGKSVGQAISIDDFFIARADRDSAATINAALESGKHLLLTPGIYHLNEPIRVTRADCVVLGIGYATLAANNGTPAMVVADVSGVKIASVLFEAGEIESPTLLQVGEPGNAASHADNPIFLYDIFCRAGGATVGRTKCMVTINSSNVVGDNFWLWRADHGTGAKWDINRNNNGLIVNGNDVTMYGLFVEHQHEYQTLWNGNGGRVYFYQSEMPYDPPSAQAWSHDGVQGYASYKVADHVTTHEGYGMGVYCVFNAASIIADRAFEAPNVPGVKLNHLITIRLNGKPNSGIKRVLNDQGESVIDQQKAQLN